jgi:hypothetical protein
MEPYTILEVNTSQIFFKKQGLKDYLFDQHMVNLPRVWFGRVGAGEGL